MTATRESNVIKVRRMVLASLLMAIVIVMGFTPLGFLKIGVIEITFLMIPVAIGAGILGPQWGLFLGIVFGLVSFFQCFGYSAFGTALMAINPVGTFITCVIPRCLMGLLSGFIFMALYKKSKNVIVSSVVTCISGALLNTGLFTTSFLLFFRNADLTSAFGMNLSDFTIIEVAGILITVNAIIEVIVCGIVGSVIVATVIKHFRTDFGKKSLPKKVIHKDTF